MILIALIAGTILPALLGWLLLDILQRNCLVLTRLEHAAAGGTLGMTLWTLLMFVVHTITGVPLRAGVLMALLIGCIALAALARSALCSAHRARPLCATSTPLPSSMRILAMVLGIWICVKVIVSASTFLLLTPTYLDDTLDNWNLRGKVFFVDHALTLTLPAEDPLLSPLGVSSYPPSVPLTKTWLALLAGTWSEPLINMPHVLWYVAVLCMTYGALRRRVGLKESLLGTYLLSSIPLYLLHGTNPYGDVFVSLHVLIAAIMVLDAVSTTDTHARASFVAIAAMAIGLLTYTKNEGLLVYAPPLACIMAVGFLMHTVRGQIPLRETLRHLSMFLVGILVLALPWLIFKWTHHLTFGNAKPVGSLGIGWQPGVVEAIWINTLFEGNWLLLFPVAAGLLLYRWKRAWTTLWPLTAFFFITYLGQMSLFLWTALSVEALRQTGYARGIIQLVPVLAMLCVLLLVRSTPHLQTAKENG